jgi:hypothetical protein
LRTREGGVGGEVEGFGEGGEAFAGGKGSGGMMGEGVVGVLGKRIGELWGGWVGVIVW